MSDKWTDTIVPEGKALYLCLNGHSLTRKASGYTINVYGTLVLCDCNGSGQGKGAISHGKEEDGSFCGTEGVYATKNATFTMYGGKICNNNGGVLVSGGTFTMYGGEISKNKRTALDTETITYSAEGGGGVWVKDYKSWSSGQTTLGNFAMYGGKISDNEVQSKIYGGGGVCMDSDGSFYMENGTITGNKCNNSGGGLDIRCETITIKGNSTISGNTCGGDGGGIFAISSAESSITNCTISNNAATGKSSKGGGLAFQNSTFTLEKCTITGNKAQDRGGGIFVLDNTANLTLSSGLNFSGNQDNCPADKSGNLTTGTANDVFLHTGAYLRLASDFSKTSTAPIVVTTYFTPSDNSYQKIAVDNRTTPDPTDFKYGNDDTAICTYTVTEGENKTVELRACKHSGAWKPNTDDASSGHWRKCTNCDTTETASHSGGEASCTKKAVCQVCHKSYGGLAAHDYDTTKWVKIDNDHHGHKCKNCNAIDESTKASHTWDDGEVTTQPKCEETGEKTYTCNTCNAKKTETIDASGHTEVTDAAVEATCTEPGKTEGKHCSVCNTVLVEQTTVPASGHTEVTDAAVEATCTKTGLTEGKHCSVCNTVLVEQTTIPAKGHTEVVDAAVEATCTEPGKTEGKHCSVCNAVLVAQKVIPAKGHTEVVDAAVEATCTKTGLTEGKHCSVCGAVIVAQTTVPAKAHDWGTQWISDDSDKNHHWHKCNNCNAIDTTSKAPHDWNSGTVTTPATCTTAGEKTFTCTACSATKTEPVPATGHTPGAAVRENEVAATCTTAGSYDEVVYCTACGNEVSRTQKTIDKLAHDYDTTKWVKADENQHGHKCKNCDAITDLTAHVPGAAATETTPQLCTVCGYVIAPATHPVHTWVFVAETPATCNAAGEREHYKCACGRTSFKNGNAYKINEDASVLTIEKNSANHTGAPDSKWHSDSANHWQEYTCCYARANEAAHSGGAATCTAQAVCQVCGKAYGPLAAHAWQPATCTAPKTCTACHVTDGAALGHDWGAWKVTTPATKDAPGVETRTCTHNSAHTETRSIPKLSTTVYTVSEDTKIAQIEAKVDGLDKILESDENKALVNDGKSVGVSLTVKNTASSGVSEKIKEKLAGSNLVGLRLELTVEKTVTANGVVESKQTIPDAGVLLKTTITLPAELQGKSGYVVYRLHDENVHVLTETANENGEFISVSADKTQITICARLYSEYVIAYQTGGSSGGGYHPVNPTPVKATSANTGDAGVLLYGVTAALSLTGTAWLGAKSRKH